MLQFKNNLSNSSQKKTTNLSFLDASIPPLDLKDQIERKSLSKTIKKFGMKEDDTLQYNLENSFNLERKISLNKNLVLNENTLDIKKNNENPKNQEEKIRGRRILGDEFSKIAIGVSRNESTEKKMEEKNKKDEKEERLTKGNKRGNNGKIRRGSSLEGRREKEEVYRKREEEDKESFLVGKSFFSEGKVDDALKYNFLI
jgi:hypothetical protein